VVRGGRQHWRRTLASESSPGPAESETLCMRGHSMLENREISIASGRYLPERSGKACGHKPDVNAMEKSDIGVVPKKEPNNAQWRRRLWREGR
jgi:hypothetical protein